MIQLKPPIPYCQQIEKLRSKGCQVTDEAFCTQVLSRINYYRLSAYFLPFKKNDGNYLPDTDFNTIYQIYEFDRCLRNLLFAGIEEVEVYLRAKLAHYHACKYGAMGYQDAANFNTRHCHENFRILIDAEIEKNKKILFVQHHNNKYGGQFPLWVISELFTFGMLSCLFSDLLTQDQKQLARDMFGTNISKNLGSWFRCCTDLRNICAHYGRLYFRIFAAVPANLPGLDENSKRRLFGVILVLRELYPDANKWNDEIYARLKKTITKFSHVIKLDHIGFPADWELRLKK